MTFDEELEMEFRFAMERLCAEHGTRGENPSLSNCFRWLLREFLSDKLERVRAAREPGVCTCPR